MRVEQPTVKDAPRAAYVAYERIKMATMAALKDMDELGYTLEQMERLGIQAVKSAVIRERAHRMKAAMRAGVE